MVSGLEVRVYRTITRVAWATEARPKAHFTLGHLLSAYSLWNLRWAHLLVGLEQLGFGERAPEGLITPASEAGLSPAHCSAPALLPVLLPHGTPAQSLMASGPLQWKSPKMHCSCLLGARECV